MDMQLAMRRGFGLSAWLAAFIRVSVAVIVSTADSLLAAEWNGRPARERASAGAGTASGAAPKGRSGRCRGSAGALRTASARRWLGCVFNVWLAPRRMIKGCSYRGRSLPRGWCSCGRRVLEESLVGLGDSGAVAGGEQIRRADPAAGRGPRLHQGGRQPRAVLPRHHP
jgi:hypothetical protein